jgi:DNA-binding transcriptional LysR family regulator
MLLRHLLEERIHIGIAPFSSVPQSIKLVKLHKETQVLYCSSSHELFDVKDDELTIDTIGDFQYAARNYLQNWSPPESSHFKIAASTGDMEAMLLYILSGRFIGYLPKHYGEPWVRSGKIKSLLENDLSYESQFFLASRNDEKNIVVLDFIKQFTKDIVQEKKSLKSVKSG